MKGKIKINRDVKVCAPRTYVETPDYCQNCDRQLKSSDKYKILPGRAPLPDGHWTKKKKCRKCGHVNVTDYGKEEEEEK